MAKHPVTKGLLACVAGAGLYIMWTTYHNMGGSGLSVERWDVREVDLDQSPPHNNKNNNNNNNNNNNTHTHTHTHTHTPNTHTRTTNQ
jgi:ABC-type nickel/cobalt efflux system permease component RcnA